MRREAETAWDARATERTNDMTDQPLTTAATAGNEAAAQQAAATPAIDPNTMQAETPKELAPLPIAQEHESFVDEWAKAPNDTPPVRTWMDPTARQTPQGEFLSAWHDEPVQATAAPATPAATPAAPAATPTAAAPIDEAALKAAMDKIQADKDAAAAKEAIRVNSGWDSHKVFADVFGEGPGEGAGGPGDGSGIGSATSATGANGEGIGNGVGGSAAGSGVGDGGSNGDNA